MLLKSASALSLVAFALTVSPVQAQHVELDVRQVVLQNVMNTIGAVGINGSATTSIPIPYPGICWWGPIPYPCIKWTSCTAGYSWSITGSNIQVQVVPGSIPFSGNGSAQASAGLCGVNVSASYSPAFNGAMTATWNTANQQLWFAMQSFLIEIYVNLLGFHITLGWVNVGGMLPNPLYKMNLPLANTVMIPPPINKSITATMQGPAVTLLAGLVRVTTNLGFTSP